MCQVPCCAFYIWGNNLVWYLFIYCSHCWSLLKRPRGISLASSCKQGAKPVGLCSFVSHPLGCLRVIKHPRKSGQTITAHKTRSLGVGGSRMSNVIKDLDLSFLQLSSCPAVALTSELVPWWSQVWSCNHHDIEPKEREFPPLCLFYNWELSPLPTHCSDIF